MAQGQRTIDAVVVVAPRETGLWIQEVVLLVDVQIVLLDVAVGVGIVFIVVSVGLETDVAVLHVGKDVPLVVDVVGSL